MVLIGIAISILAAIYELFTYQRGIVWIPYMFVDPAILLLPRLIYSIFPNIRQRVNLHQIKRLELFGTIILAANIPGSLFFHTMGFQYDRILHFLMGIMSVLMISAVFSIFYKNPKNDRKSILIWSGLLVFPGLFLFEYWQYTADRFFGSKLFFDAVQDVSVDFREDIIFGIIGMIAGLSYSYIRFIPFLITKYRD